MNVTQTISFFATMGFGKYVKAPGTLACIVTLPLVWFLHYSWYFYDLVLLFSLIASCFIVHYALPSFSESDPAAIVLDEYVGCLITFWYIPLNFPLLILGFCLFRFFDISKIGCGFLQKLPNMWGVMADDIGAGILANLFLRLFL